MPKNKRGIMTIPVPTNIVHSGQSKAPRISAIMMRTITKATKMPLISILSPPNFKVIITVVEELVNHNRGEPRKV